MTSFLKHVRGLGRTWSALSTRNKLIYGSLIFNSALALGILVHTWQLDRRSRQLWEDHLCQVDTETEGWRCYTAAKLFREQCSNAAFTASSSNASSVQSTAPHTLHNEGDESDAFCARVWNAVTQCSEQLYAAVANRDLPAMRPSVPLVNRPHWLKEPEWLAPQ